MSDNILEPIAYHESGRIVFTYLNGYVCDGLEVAETGGVSKLNAGQDLPVVQAVFTGKPESLPADQREQGIAVAKKLMAIYCAGTCAEIFHENNATIPAELELEIQGTDARNIEIIQKFLAKAVPGHPDDFPVQTMITVLQQLKEHEVWKAVNSLATKVLESETKTLTRFYIEDTLMAAGIKFKKPTTGSGANIGLKEDKSPRTSAFEKKPAAFELPDESPLDIVLKDFLTKVKTNWKDGEMENAVGYLKGVFKKYGNP